MIHTVIVCPRLHGPEQEPEGCLKGNKEKANLWDIPGVRDRTPGQQTLVGKFVSVDEGISDKAWESRRQCKWRFMRLSTGFPLILSLATIIRFTTSFFAAEVTTINILCTRVL